MQGIESFLSVVPNPMMLVNAQGVIELANEHACSLFGYASGELTGKSVAALMPERFRETHAKHLEVYFQSPYAREMGNGMELTACRADGSEFPVEISLNLYGGTDRVYTLASVRKIADRKATEVRMRHLNRVLAMQGRINALIVRVHDRDELFRVACRIAVEAGAFRMAWIGLLDVDTREIRVAASFGERASEYLEGIEEEAPFQRGRVEQHPRADRDLSHELDVGQRPDDLPGGQLRGILHSTGPAGSDLDDDTGTPLDHWATLPRRAAGGRHPGRVVG